MVQNGGLLMNCVMCAACAKPRATDDEHERLTPDCVSHRTCPLCDGMCWFWNDRACADASGGWREVLATERARTASALEERDQAIASLAKVEREVDELLERSEKLEQQVTAWKILVEAAEKKLEERHA